MPEAIHNLPIFPLGTVLVPQMLMPLHIFEDRYKEMLRECLEGSKTFGIALITSGPEGGRPVEPHPVGTLATIQQVRSLPKGEFFIYVLGDRRFRIRQITQEAPFLRADLELVEDEEEPTEALVGDVELLRELGERYVNVMAAARERPPEDLPDDPVTLGWFMAARLPFEPRQQQALLESISLRERLRAMARFLAEEMPRIEKDAAVVYQMRQIRKSNGQPFRVQGAEDADGE